MDRNIVHVPLSPNGNVIEVITSRGSIEIIDTHIFEIVIPADTKDLERLVITVGNKSFRIKGLVDASNEIGLHGERTAC